MKVAVSTTRLSWAFCLLVSCKNGNNDKKLWDPEGKDELVRQSRVDDGFPSDSCLGTWVKLL